MKHLWMECPSCGLKYRNEVYDELVACVEDVLLANGDLYAMDFDRYRAALAKVTNEKTTDQG